MSMIPRDEETRADMRETLSGHVHLVLTECDEWPDDCPEPSDLGEGAIDVIAAWAYATGYANALRVTVRELAADLGVSLHLTAEEDAEPVTVDVPAPESPCPDCQGRGWDHFESSYGEEIERCDTCQALPDDDAAVEAHRRTCGCDWPERAPR